MNGQNSDDRQWPGYEEDQRSLADAYVRIDTARRNLELLHAEVSNFVRKTVEMMAIGWSRERNTFVVNLPPADLAHKGKVNNKIRRLCGSITEDLRSALDYGITKVASLTKPDMVEKEKSAVQFIIAHNEISFKRQAKRALKYVGEPIKSWMENLQPHHGNQVLEFIGGASGSAKHRSLPKVRHATSLTIVLQEDTGRSSWEESGWWVFPAGKGHVFLTRAGPSQLIIRKKHDALTVFPICIEHTQGIINTLEYYLQTGHLPKNEIPADHSVRQKVTTFEPERSIVPAQDKRSLEEILAEHGSDIPKEEWDRLPDDLIENLDHYTAGADKNADRPGRNVEEILEDYAGRVPAEEWDRLPPDLIERLDYYTSGADV